MSLGFLTLDILIILAIFVITFVFSFVSGKRKIIKFLLIVYPSILVFQNLPFAFKDNLTQIGAFVGIFIVFYFLLRNNLTSPFGGSSKFIGSLMTSIAAVFCLLIIYYKILPLESIFSLKLPFSGFWIQKIPFYITLTIPAVLIAFVSRKED